MLYVRVYVALYGCLESALLWYNLYVNVLKENGFTLNPYDKCVANKIIDGKQCTIVFYVDDNKVSHVNPRVVDDILAMLESHFGKMKTSRGKIHKFLGMDINFMKDKSVKIEMKQQLLEAIEIVGEPVDDKVSTPANKKPFEIDDEAETLIGNKSRIFHSTVAKLLYLCKRGKPDIETAVAFLYTRVSKSDVHDWKKLLRVLGFLKVTINDARYIAIDNIKHLFSWADASYAVHHDMKSHTVGATSFGRGIICSKSSKQKINTKSSTEAELVGICDFLPYPLWFLLFLKHQGYTLDENIIFRDNESAMRLEKKGRNLCTGNSRHIDIKYFFVKDRINNGDVSISYCPTLNMLADFYT